MMKKTRFTMLVLVLALSGTMISSAQSADKPVKGGTLVIADASEVSSLVWFNFTSPDDYVQTLPLYESLLNVDKSGQPQPYLCESIKPDPTALTYTIKLKKGILFHDGSELDAEACKWSLETYKVRGKKSASFFPMITSFEATDKYTVVIHLSAWDSTIPQSLARECGYMFSKQAWDTKGEKYCLEHPVGTGPFVFESWERDVGKSYVKFPKYWQGEPLLDKVQIKIYTDSLVAQAALESGDIHAYYCNDYALNASMAKKGFKVARGTIPLQMPFLLFNSVNKDDPFYNLQVRQAISYAIDQKALCDVVYYGYVRPTNQFAPKGSAYYSPKVVGYPYNPAKTKEMLAKAGYPNGFKTTLGAKNEPTIVACVTAIQAQLAKVGVTVDLNIIQSGDYAQALTGWKSGLFFHATGLPAAIINQANSMWRQGLSGIVLGLTSIMRPDDVNAILINAMTAKTEKEAQQYMQQCQVMMIDKYCMFWPIGVGDNTYIKSTRLHDDGIGEITYQIATLWKGWIK